MNRLLRLKRLKFAGIFVGGQWKPKPRVALTLAWHTDVANVVTLTVIGLQFPVFTEKGWTNTEEIEEQLNKNGGEK